MQLLQTAIKAIKDKKGNNIVSLEFLPEQSSVCDYFVICEAESDRQVKAISKSIQDTIREELGQKPIHLEGMDNANWVLLDYFDVIIHVFQREAREFYALEKLWADAKQQRYE